ncbi:MAG: hypothetical protein HZA93_24665 [Verrucomicrobia bacterium]|nr:hypothetical protein [Verrucomicrobiota bacterium]
MNTNLLPSRSRWLRLATLALAAAALLTTGCTGVYIARPIGDQPHVLAAADWEGTWILGDSAFVVRVAEARAGRLEFRSTKIRDGQFATETGTMLLRESGDWLLATLVDDEHPDRSEWARIKRDADRIVILLPDKQPFRALVQSGKLQGRLLEDNVVLDPLTAADLTALTSGALGAPFRWMDPIVIHRLPH